MRNMVGTQQALERAYIETETTSGGSIPDSPELGKPLDTVTGVDKVVKVDVFVPGCPPSADAFYYVISELLAGRKPVLPPELFKYD
jgi:NAD-reducing hydrogenase small subunit